MIEIALLTCPLRALILISISTPDIDPSSETNEVPKGEGHARTCELLAQLSGLDHRTSSPPEAEKKPNSDVVERTTTHSAQRRGVREF